MKFGVINNISHHQGVKFLAVYVVHSPLFKASVPNLPKVKI